MLSRRWGGATAAAVLVTALAIFNARRGGPDEVWATPPEPGTGPVLRGTLEAPGVDPLLCVARCSALHPESNPSIHEADLDVQGHFMLTGLADDEYRLEIVVRSNPALVVACMKAVRPDKAELVLVHDPAFLFGPVGRAESEEE